MRFITAIITDELTVNRVKRAIILSMLRDQGYTPMSEIEKILPKSKASTVVVKAGDEEGSERPEAAEEAGDTNFKDYDYLLSMALWSLTDEKVAALEQQLKDKKAEFEELQATHIYKLWDRDLDRFLEELTKYERKEEADRRAHVAKQSGGAAGKRRRAPKKAVAQKNTSSDEKKPAKPKATKVAQKRTVAPKQQV